MVLRKNLVMGTFTHRTKYLPELLDSVKQFCPDIPFIVHIQDDPIVKNFEALRMKFKATGKRYWLFLDDDIQFIREDTIDMALCLMEAQKYAMVGIYYTHNSFYNSVEGLTAKEVKWLPGYFQLCDSFLIGDISADSNLPCPNTGIDITFCLDVIKRGYKIGQAPTLVYHNYKQTPCNWEVDRIVKEYMTKKWGDVYTDAISVPFRGCIGPFPTSPRIGGNYFIDFEVLKEGFHLFTKIVTERRAQAIKNSAVRLHLGCGENILDGYRNIDLNRVVSDHPDFSWPVVTKLQDLSGYKNKSVAEIVCQHALEHIPITDISLALKEWHRVLKKNGLLELSIPDLNLCCQAYVITGEPWFVKTIYGSQEREGMFHLNGMSLVELKDLLISIGFEIDYLFNYDSWNTPSVVAFARKL